MLLEGNILEMSTHVRTTLVYFNEQELYLMPHADVAVFYLVQAS